MRILQRVSLFSLLVLVILSCKPAISADSRYIRHNASSQSVIVFVHGILGDGISTWTAENKSYWPDMLTHDQTFNDCDVYVYEYPTPLWGAPFSIDEVAENMRLLFEVDGVSSHKELIFIAHSMGGLVVRSYLLKNRVPASRARLIYFFSTPTTGSELASIASLIATNPQLAKMQPMKSSDFLADLQRQWLAADLNIPSYCAYETSKTYGISVVTQASASNLCTKRLDPIDANHISIVKPSDTRQMSYLAFKSAFLQTPSIVPVEVSKNIIMVSTSQFNHQQFLAAQGYMTERDIGTHTALLLMDAAFSDDRFNNQKFLRSFDRISVTIKEVDQARPKDVDARFFDCSLTSVEKFRCIIILRFKSEPRIGSELQLVIGPVTKRQIISSSTFKWEAAIYDRYNKAIPWWVASSEVHYVIDRPNWLVFTDAEMLTGQGGLSLVRVSFSNPTDTSASLRWLHLVAVYPETSCLFGPTSQPQTVTLNWEKIVSRSSDAATTVLNGVKIPVVIRYDFVGRCTDYFFAADVPLDETVEAHTEAQISLRLKEIPTRNRGRPTSRLDPPHNLAAWRRLEMSFDASAGTLLSPITIEIHKF